MDVEEGPESLTLNLPLLISGTRMMCGAALSVLTGRTQDSQITSRGQIKGGNTQVK